MEELGRVRMQGWKNGRIRKSKNGRMEEWKD
jgi:hypothetical protein